jgi:hypothetical protein
MVSMVSNYSFTYPLSNLKKLSHWITSSVGSLIRKSFIKATDGNGEAGVSLFVSLIRVLIGQWRNKGKQFCNRYCQMKQEKDVSH